MAKATKKAPAKKAASKTTASSATKAAPAKDGHISMDDVAIQISSMNKWYGDFHVLRDIDLTVYRANALSFAGRPDPASQR